MGEEIDVVKLKEAKPAVGRKFLKIKPPEGKTFFAYRLKFLGEPHQRESRKFTNPDGTPKIDTLGDVLIMAKVNDDEVEVGKEAVISMSANLLRQVETQKPLTGKIFDIMNRGKPKGKAYYDYAALLQQGTLAWSVLEKLLRLN